MRRMVVVGLVGGAAVAAAVFVATRRPPASTLIGEPDWAPLTLTGPGDAAAVPGTDARATMSEAFAAAATEPTVTEPVTATAGWVEADAAGECPDSHPVKGSRSSRIYHVPGGHFYARTKAERCFCDAEAAEANGYRAAKR